MTAGGVRVQRGVDRRRQFPTGTTGRRQSERILAMAEHLPARDRRLLEQVYRHGLAVSDLAALTGIRARNLQRRITRLIERTQDPLFRFVAAQGDLLPPELRPVARRRILEGRSLRDTARRTRTSLHRVRARIHEIELLADLWGT